MECVLEPRARPAPLARSVLGEGARATVRTRRHSEYILGSLEMLKKPERCTKIEVWGMGAGRSRRKRCKTENLEESGC